MTGVLRRVRERFSLRMKLIAAVLALVALTLVVISVVSVSALRSHLLGETDGRLRRIAGGVVDELDDGGRPARGVPSATTVQLRAQDGTLVRTVWDESAGPLPDLPGTPAELASRDGRPYTLTDDEDGRSWRVLVLRAGDDGHLVVATGLADLERTVDRLVVIDLVVGAVVMVVLAGTGIAVVRASLRPLMEIEDAAGEIAAGNLSRRVPGAHPGTEVGRLSASLNGMLAQIESAFRARARSQDDMRRFIADASHELRTPLTAIRGFAELGGRRSRDASPELSALFGRIEGAAGRMGLLVEDLLLLARLDQRRPLDRAPVDLLALLADAVQDVRIGSPDRPITLEVAQDAAYLTNGDEARIRQVFANLLANAVTHTPPGTPVTVRLHGAAAAVCEVEDRGPGLPADQLERVFDRFYQADTARAKGGTGLGLAIVAALVAAHDGTVEAESTPGAGTTFRVVLPLSSS